MDRIFVSSLARGEMGAIRQGARDGVESLGMLPVMYETQPASDQNSRRALLDQIPNCDAYLLLLGAEYGEPMESGLSPTEEEFEEALRTGRPVLALVQQGVDREERQQQFVARVRGSWEGGHFAPTFTGSGDIVAAVVRTLNGWRSSGPDASDFATGACGSAWSRGDRQAVRSARLKAGTRRLWPSAFARRRPRS